MIDHEWGDYAEPPRKPNWRERIRRFAAENLTLDGGAASLARDQAVVVEAQRRELRSLRASLDDANATISRLSGEKHARDVALRRVIEAAESVHEGERAGE